MSKTTNKEKLYHQIALACLKALKNSDANTQESIGQVYKAIDSAFNQQVSLLAHELDEAKQKLSDISQLDSERHSLADAQSIAQSNKAQH